MTDTDVRELRDCLRKKIAVPEVFVGGDLDGQETYCYKELKEAVNEVLARLEAMYPEAMHNGAGSENRKGGW